jgi:hypothetical protein
MQGKANAVGKQTNANAIRKPPSRRQAKKRVTS